MYLSTQAKCQQLKQNYILVSLWECQFCKLKETDPELQTFLTDFEIIPPLNPRDAFFGARINADKFVDKEIKMQSFIADKTLNFFTIDNTNPLIFFSSFTVKLYLTIKTFTVLA